MLPSQVAFGIQCLVPTELTSTNSDFYSEFDLVAARLVRAKKQAAPHQDMTLGKLAQWFSSKHPAGEAGGIVVLPTGGGKTFTAVRFLCRHPLSQGYRVLWLAHTHHLLEQAFDSFAPRNDAQQQQSGMEIANIAEPKNHLSIRVVSGTPGHFPVSSIKGNEDVLIVTLQTMARAWQNREGHPGLRQFLNSAGERLVVVFDEAHHSPAPGYRTLITELRQQHRQMLLLGLTATPTYNDERKKGWLKKLFPQGIIYQVSAKKLIADGILARPKFETTPTDIVPNFSQREFQKWVGSYRDLPEDVIESLSANRERNTLIAETYLKNQERFGKTIIFAERWHQCVFLCGYLEKRGVSAGAVFSHVDATLGTVEARNRRGKDENSKVLENFKSGKLQVLINVKMLTEGTDVPEVSCVFITRQSTSQILTTQMVGRALRGPKFGGTATAYIVSFTDNWQHHIQFADYQQLEDETPGGTETTSKKRPPLQLISIELVRRLARQMDTGITVSPAPFLSLMPVGWYSTEFDALVTGTDDTETIRDLVLVFDDNEENFSKCITWLKGQNLSAFSGEEIVLETMRSQIEKWTLKFFGSEPRQIDELHKSLLDIARHMAQSGEAPTYFPYEERAQHDLDAVASQFLQAELSRKAEFDALVTEYQRRDRYWPTLYMSFPHFKSQYDACVNRLQELPHDPTQTPIPPIRKATESLPEREPSEELKAQVLRRDKYCLCCASTRRLQIDHIAPSYLGGNNSLSNLQTLCAVCNLIKGINELNFTTHKHPGMAKAPASLPQLSMPEGNDARDAEKWSSFLRRALNFYYRAAAVEMVKIGGKGRGFYEWEVILNEGNEPQWLNPHLKELVIAIRGKIREARNDNSVMERLTISSPSRDSVSWPLRSHRRWL